MLINLCYFLCYFYQQFIYFLVNWIYFRVVGLEGDVWKEKGKFGEFFNFLKDVIELKFCVVDEWQNFQDLNFIIKFLFRVCYI